MEEAEAANKRGIREREDRERLGGARCKYLSCGDERRLYRICQKQLTLRFNSKHEGEKNIFIHVCLDNTL